MSLSITFLLVWLFASSDRLVNADIIYAAGSSSASAIQTCSSDFCGNTTTFLIQEDNCPNPVISVAYKFTDFSNTETQYFTITVNNVRLGFCRGTEDGIRGVFYRCISEVSLREIVGKNPVAISVELHLSPKVQNPYEGYLLWASTIIKCLQTKPLSNINRVWDIAQQSSITDRIACATAGCTAQATYNVTQVPSIAQCRLPLLSLAFWLTDFDKAYEYLTVEVNDNYLGICEGGKQDNYTDIYNCFEQVDVSRYTGEYPSQINIKVTIKATVDRGWLSDGYSPYLLDSQIELACTNSSQDDKLPSLRRFTNSGDNEDRLVVDCQEVECGGLFTWRIADGCDHPYLSLDYYSEHYDDSMVQVVINERVFGYCGPAESADDQLNFSVIGNITTRSCFDQLEISGLLGNGWSEYADTADDFKFGFALAAIDALDGIRNGLVAKLVFTFGCQPTIVVANENKKSLDLSTANSVSANFGCVHAACSASTIFELGIPAQYQNNPDEICPLPVLDLLFYLTDFKLDTEYLSVYVNDRLYGLCNGGGDELETGDKYQCLYQADISSYINLLIAPNISIRLNASSQVNALDSANPPKQLISATAIFSCLDITHDPKITAGVLNVLQSVDTSESSQLHYECQGVGCSTTVDFDVIGTCRDPTLSLAFWLSDFVSFQKYVDVSINEIGVDRCYGGGGLESFDAIYFCFQEKDITSFLTAYEYNSGDDTSGYVIRNDTLSIHLQLSNASLWLDRSYNHSVLDGHVSLSCTTDVDSDDYFDFDNDTNDDIDFNSTNFNIVQLRMTIQRISADHMNQYSSELRDRFEYVLGIITHVYSVQSDTISFYLRTQVEVIHVTQSSALHIYVVASSNDDAEELMSLIKLPIFIYYLQETLRDSHFSSSYIENIDNIKLIDTLPDTDSPTYLPSNAPTIAVEHVFIESTEDIEFSLEDGSSASLIEQLFSSAKAADVLAFIAVLFVLVLVCLCLVGVCTFMCVRHKQKKTRQVIGRYQTQMSVSNNSLTHNSEERGTLFDTREQDSSSDDDDDDNVGVAVNGNINEMVSISLGSGSQFRKNASFRSQRATQLNGTASAAYSPLKMNKSQSVGDKIRRLSSAKRIRKKVRRASASGGALLQRTRSMQKTNSLHRGSSQQRSDHNVDNPSIHVNRNNTTPVYSGQNHIPDVDVPANVANFHPALLQMTNFNGADHQHAISNMNQRTNNTYTSLHSNTGSYYSNDPSSINMSTSGNDNRNLVQVIEEEDEPSELTSDLTVTKPFLDDKKVDDAESISISVSLPYGQSRSIEQIKKAGVVSEFPALREDLEHSARGLAHIPTATSVKGNSDDDNQSDVSVLSIPEHLDYSGL